MSKKRILIVNASALGRRLLSEAVASMEGYESAGTAASVRIAQAKLRQSKPDVIILDPDLGDTTGATAVRTFKELLPDVPILLHVAEESSARRVEVTQALSAGAVDVVLRRRSAGGDAVAKTLAPALGAIFGVPSPSRPSLLRSRAKPAERALRATVKGSRTRLSISPDVSAKASGPEPAAIASSSQGRRVNVLAIGCSTGGPRALESIIPHLGADFPVPVVITQHMPPKFTEALARQLSKKSKLEVVEASAGMTLEPGRAYIAPGDYHMTFTRSGTKVVVMTSQGPPENSCRPAVDPMLRSIVSVYKNAVYAVILTGMGHDGLRGCKVVKEAGGMTLVQDEASSVVWGMPGFVAKAGFADRVLPLDQMAFEINRKIDASPSIRKVRRAPKRAKKAI